MDDHKADSLCEVFQDQRQGDLVPRWVTVADMDVVNLDRARWSSKPDDLIKTTLARHRMVLYGHTGLPLPDMGQCGNRFDPARQHSRKWVANPGDQRERCAMCVPRGRARRMCAEIVPALVVATDCMHVFLLQSPTLRRTARIEERQVTYTVRHCRTKT